MEEARDKMKAPKVIRTEFTLTAKHPWIARARILLWCVKFAALHSRITITPTYKGKPIPGKLHMRVIPKITIVKEGAHT